jgi:S-adenosylmethionine synthetase
MGHPDKIADQVSDAVLDALLAKDPNSRVACETLVTTNLCVIAGEVTSQAKVDYEKIARDTIVDIGYDNADYGMDGRTCEVIVRIDAQSPDISQGVTQSASKEQGAGDQGLMFGFACDETSGLMPFPIHYSHRLVSKLAELRKTGALPWLRPDSKSQLTVEYEGDRPARVHTVVVSTQHAPEMTWQQVHDQVIERVIRAVIPADMLDERTIYHINPTGRFVIGGPHGDCGLTGRKIIVDTYGGMGRHGGGAFSGKDPSKVDRSAAYAARWVAKNVVAAKLARRCEVQVSYAIGVAKPLSVRTDTFGTGTVPEDVLTEAISSVFDLRPASIIADLGLKKPIYRQTAAGGHFGREGLPWERVDRVAALQDAVAALAR